MRTLCFIFLCCVIFHVTPAHAQAWDQFKTGAKDFVTAPLELGRQTSYYINEYDEEPLTGAVAGMVEGVGATGAKLIRGFFKMVSAPFADEDDYYFEAPYDDSFL